MGNQKFGYIKIDGASDEAQDVKVYSYHVCTESGELKEGDRVVFDIKTKKSGKHIQQCAIYCTLEGTEVTGKTPRQQKLTDLRKQKRKEREQKRKPTGKVL